MTGGFRNDSGEKMMKEIKKNRGLTTEYIRELSARKKEPKWMLELRL